MCRVNEYTLYVYKFVWTNRYLGSDRCTKDTSKHVILQSRTYRYGWFDMIRNSTQQKNYLNDILQVSLQDHQFRGTLMNLNTLPMSSKIYLGWQLITPNYKLLYTLIEKLYFVNTF